MVPVSFSYTGPGVSEAADQQRGAPVSSSADKEGTSGVSDNTDSDEPVPNGRK